MGVNFFASASQLKTSDYQLVKVFNQRGVDSFSTLVLSVFLIRFNNRF